MGFIISPNDLTTDDQSSSIPMACLHFQNGAKPCLSVIQNYQEEELRVTSPLRLFLSIPSFTTLPWWFVVTPCHPLSGALLHQSSL